MICSECGYTKNILPTITDAHGTKVLCLNCVMDLIAEEKLNLVPSDEYICEVTGKRGAVHFENRDEKYTLSVEIMKRLLKKNLTKDEFKKLVENNNGEWRFLLHEDFYDEDGNCLDPFIE